MRENFSFRMFPHWTGIDQYDIRIFIVVYKLKTGLTKRDELERQVESYKRTNFNCSLYLLEHLFSGIRLTIKDAETRIEEESPPITLTVDELQGEIVSW